MTKLSTAAKLSTAPPLCKLCEQRHWLAEGHPRPSSQTFDFVTPDTRAVPVTKSNRGGARVGTGRKAVYESAAARQRAYRERSSR